jgi:hypothetical protein
MWRVISATLLIVMLASERAVSAQLHTFLVDQHNDVALATSGRGIPGTFSPLGQSFIPNFDSLDAVELELFAICTTGLSQAVSVQIRSGSITGPVIGVSAVVLVACMAAPGIQHFDFAVPVALTPGGTYVIEVVPGPINAGDFIAVFLHSANPYAFGTAILSGAADSDKDLWFREGSSLVTPTAPTTWGQVKALYR